MRLIQKRGPFRRIDVLLETLSRNEIHALTRTCSALSVLTYQPIEGLSGFYLRQKMTPNIYLSAGIDAVLAGFRDTVRNEIHRTHRLDGFEIRTSADSVDAAYDVYRSFEFSQQRAPISKEEFQLFTCFSAWYQGVCVSGISFFQSGDRIRIRSIFSARMTTREQDKELYKIIGYASKRLVYEVCAYGCVHGVVSVDLASINLTDPEKASIARFKSGFGAVIEPEYQYIWTSWWFKGFQRLAALRARLRVLARTGSMRRSA